MRAYILECGGEIHFNKKMTGWSEQTEKITEIHTADGDRFPADAVILATGHSARDIFQMLAQKKKQIHAKPFALGVRVEHPQELINAAQYHYLRESGPRVAGLPPAAYQLVHAENRRSVFSFCMCPGGIIAPASTGDGELVVNGWSPSKRNNPFANSGIVVNIDEKDWQAYSKFGDLAAMYFQQSIEQKAFVMGGGLFKAPAQRLTDFVKGMVSATSSRLFLYPRFDGHECSGCFSERYRCQPSKCFSGIRRENERLFFRGSCGCCRRIKNFIPCTYTQA